MLTVKAEALLISSTGSSKIDDYLRNGKYEKQKLKLINNP